MLHLSWDK